jgi:hypothetical protein
MNGCSLPPPWRQLALAIARERHPVSVHTLPFVSSRTQISPARGQMRVAVSRLSYSYVYRRQARRRRRRAPRRRLVVPACYIRRVRSSLCTHILIDLSPTD